MLKTKLKFSRFFFIIACFLISTGFVVNSTLNWSLTEADPTLWLKPCDTIINTTFTTNNLNSPADELGASTSVTGTVAITSIINDFNNVNSSFVRLAIYPTDPNNPGTAKVGDSTFTTTKANTRTIEVCFSNPGGVFTAGVSKQKDDGNEITGCEIKLLQSYSGSDLKKFIGTLTHELGHCMGLGHSMETVNAIMSYFHSADNFRLMIDDKMGLAFLFPNSSVDLKEKNTYGLQCSRK